MLLEWDVPSDEPVADIFEVIADNLWLRTDAQDIVADTLDQRGLPARRDGAERVPCVAGDKAEPRGFDAKLFFDVSVRLARRLMVPYAVGAESPLEQVDDAAVLELTSLHLEQIVCEGEQPEACGAQFAQCRWNLGIGRHRGEPF